MTCNDRHNIEVLLGHENYSYRYDYTYTSKTNEAFPNRYALSNFSEMASISGYKLRFAGCQLGLQQRGVYEKI